MRILSIDGGGIRGVYSAYLLQRIEDELGEGFLESFDLIAGTSTGSIIAAALAVGIRPVEIVQLYEGKGHEIFGRSTWVPGAWRTLTKLFSASYDNTALKAALDASFGDRKMSDVRIPLLLPATNIGQGIVHVFKSPYDPSFVRDGSVRIADAVLASCSAPTFFRPHEVNSYALADGGLWANNPALVSIVDAVRRFNCRLDELHLLAIGTGSEEFAYPDVKAKAFGLIRYGLAWWGPKKFIDLLLSLQSQTSDNMSKLLLGDRYMRLNFVGTGLVLDEPSSIRDLKARADQTFTYAANEIRNFAKENLGYRREGE